ncbi:DUF4326 domain-containing protein [Variovorax sp. LjRoot175]|uniref:DUF4326 domain-containing protein n=1 Tax=Variovorax sp. LjRoot175 TaxID=3342276 RepID=UPI003F51A838
MLAAAKAELRGKDLVCWWAPEACHADVLLRIANEDPAPPLQSRIQPTSRLADFP